MNPGSWAVLIIIAIFVLWVVYAFGGKYPLVVHKRSESHSIPNEYRKRLIDSVNHLHSNPLLRIQNNKIGYSV